MLRLSHTVNRDAVARLLAEAVDGPYDAGRVIGEKLRDGYRGKPVITAITAGGDPVAASVTCGEFLRLLAVHHDHRGKGLGAALLAEAEDRVSATQSRIIIFAEPGNYFTPGVPAEMAGFYLHRGYRVTAEAVNLTAPTRDFAAPGIRRAEAAERERLLDWIGAAFGPIWAFETSRAFEHAIPTLVLDEQEGEIRGFSAWGANNAALGGYGPAGVAAALRGRGLGRELLLASLSEMRREGFEHALIQWAAALDFYERCAGARVAHRFLVMEKRFGA